MTTVLLNARPTHRFHSHQSGGLGLRTFLQPRLEEAPLHRISFIPGRRSIPKCCLRHHGKPVSSLSSPHSSQCITQSCDHSSHDHRVRQDYLKFFSSDYPPSPFSDRRGNLDMIWSVDILRFETNSSWMSAGSHCWYACSTDVIIIISHH